MTDIKGNKGNQAVGAVMVAGGGISGIQAALDLANSGYFVYLVERSSAIGGTMAKLDKTFPTNDCSMCIVSPKLVECGQHPNIRLIVNAEIEDISGEEGNLLVQVLRHPGYVNLDKCVGCGICASKCPKEVANEFNSNLNTRKAIYLPYAQAVPMKYTIDAANCLYLKSVAAGGKGKCGACQKYCQNQAIEFDQKEEIENINVGSVILAPGFEAFDPGTLDLHGYGKFPDVVTSVAFERILSASGPYGGHLVRPSDGKSPKRIAWLQCIGSRNINRCKNGYCSAVCCMYAIKEAVIAREHSHGELDCAIFYMDMRTYGKDFEKYYERAKNESGVRFIRSRVHTVEQNADGLSLRYMSETGEMMRENFDMVVLSVGMQISGNTVRLAEKLGIELNQYKFAQTSSFSPTSTTRSGVYVCGSFREPLDIPGSVMEASAAACAATNSLSGARHTKTVVKALPPESSASRQEPRIGVFVCNCGINIGGVADVPAVTEYAAGLKNVVYAEQNLFTCSQDTQQRLKEVIKEKKLNRVVVASCSPRTHEPLFRSTVREAGLNPFLFEMANIRDQNTWVHQSEPEKATEKAKELVRMAVAKVALSKPLYLKTIPIDKTALVIGGGVAGMTCALNIADQGYPVHLVEKTGELGGQARQLNRTWKGERVKDHLAGLIDRIQQNDSITIHLKSEVTAVSGSMGNFTTTLLKKNGSESSLKVGHGVAVLATGATAYKPSEYLYGKHPNVLSWFELDKLAADNPSAVKAAQKAVFIQCVGSRNAERPYCSKVCCTHTLASALELKEINPDLSVYVLYRDIRTYGTREELYQKAREKGVLFIRYDLDNKPIVEDRDGRLVVTVKDHVLLRPISIETDLLTLMTAIVPSGHEQAARLFKVPLNAEKFFFEAHMKLRPVDFASEGLFLCGLAHYPKPLEETIAQAQAAASRAVTILSHDSTYAGGVVAEVDAEKCAACLTCVRTCPYQVPVINEEGVSEIDPAKCRGCGSCASECPAGAITVHHFTDDQIMAKVDALLLRAG